MEGSFDTLMEQLEALWLPRAKPTTWRSFRCQCGRPVFFGNSLCLGCGSPLGYEPHLERVAALRPGARAGTWKLDGELLSDCLYRRCTTFETAAGCNWLLPDDEVERHAGLCAACRLNRTIPDQSDPRATARPGTASRLPSGGSFRRCSRWGCRWLRATPKIPSAASHSSSCAPRREGRR